jgi:hypothetical protein
MAILSKYSARDSSRSNQSIDTLSPSGFAVKYLSIGRYKFANLSSSRIIAYGYTAAILAMRSQAAT